MSKREKVIVLTPQAEELLRLMADAPDYPFEQQADMRFVNALYLEFVVKPTPGTKLNLADAFLAWQTWRLDNPSRHRKNPRSGFRNWCANGVAYKRKALEAPPRNKNHIGRQAPAPQTAERPSNPGGRDARNGAPAAGPIKNVNALASGLAEKHKVPCEKSQGPVSAPAAPPPPKYRQLSPEELRSSGWKGRRATWCSGCAG